MAPIQYLNTVGEGQMEGRVDGLISGTVWTIRELHGVQCGWKLGIDVPYDEPLEALPHDGCPACLGVSTERAFAQKPEQSEIMSITVLHSVRNHQHQCGTGLIREERLRRDHLSVKLKMPSFFKSNSFIPKLYIWMEFSSTGDHSVQNYKMKVLIITVILLLGLDMGQSIPSKRLSCYKKTLRDRKCNDLGLERMRPIDSLQNHYWEGNDCDIVCYCYPLELLCCPSHPSRGIPRLLQPPVTSHLMKIVDLYRSRCRPCKHPEPSRDISVPIGSHFMFMFKGSGMEKLVLDL
ncbi:hypothetical protein C0J45_1271 [Silurus meridionalis]|uniref:Uncharacterized protein n=1 Tax=Silurus meridionalis TaxID=175797 RepID=A0A8T0BSR4_SILME|nr:hypothetical protein HF521_008946 [Silurus meridionalis]KAI5107677.1 hypothetical protein C0J45_1271 [Silurus meridionalis]